MNSSIWDLCAETVPEETLRLGLDQSDSSNGVTVSATDTTLICGKKELCIEPSQSTHNELNTLERYLTNSHPPIPTDTMN